jgi:5,6,7,8-tetrahydromethanopterin hydro-lyase
MDERRERQLSNAGAGGGEVSDAFATQIGEAFVGAGADAAHINTVLGARDGPVGIAWATALATPRLGHAPFLTVLQPGLAVRPFTLFVNKADTRGDEHARLTWGAAQAGVAGGVADAVRSGIIADGTAAELLLIAAVWVDWKAQDAAAVFANNRGATTQALTAGASGRPGVSEVLAAGEPWNPFYP